MKHSELLEYARKVFDGEVNAGTSEDSNAVYVAVSKRHRFGVNFYLYQDGVFTHVCDYDKGFVDLDIHNNIAYIVTGTRSTMDGDGGTTIIRFDVSTGKELGTIVAPLPITLTAIEVSGSGLYAFVGVVMKDGETESHIYTYDISEQDGDLSERIAVVKGKVVEIRYTYGLLLYSAVVNDSLEVYVCYNQPDTAMWVNLRTPAILGREHNTARHPLSGGMVMPLKSEGYCVIATVGDTALVWVDPIQEATSVMIVGPGTVTVPNVLIAGNRFDGKVILVNGVLHHDR